MQKEGLERFTEYLQGWAGRHRYGLCGILLFFAVLCTACGTVENTEEDSIISSAGQGNWPAGDRPQVSSESQDGTKENQDGTMESRDDAMEDQDGAMESRDDAMESQDGTMESRDDAMESQDDTMEEPDGVMESPDAGMEAEEGAAAGGPLAVDGTKLVDSSGNPVQLKGISTHGLAWYPDYINRECIRQLKEEWGMNVLRLAMYTAEYGGYCAGGDKEGLKELIRNGVDYATEYEMYVIIDWHILSDGNPNTYLEEAKDFFREMSEEYADYTNVLYEICNEPNGGVAWSEIKSYAEQVAEVIRENDQDGIILVGTPNWSQYVDQAAEDPIQGYDNIMYTLHFYAATHKEELRNTMVSAVEAGLPVFVSEYGICDASGNGGIDEYQADQWAETMDAYQISYVAWNLSNKDETSAIIKSSCNKVSGFTEEDLSDSGKWLCRMLGGKPSGGTVDY